MRRNIVWCGCVIVGWLAVMPPLVADGVPPRRAAQAGAALRSDDGTWQVGPADAPARPGPDSQTTRAATTAITEDDRAAVAATEHFLWTAPILALIGLALAWLLATSGPIV